MSANNLQKEIQHITKTAAANMDHSQIDELISNMLKNGLIYDKPTKKDTSYFIMEATNNDMKKPVITQTLILETKVVLLDVVTFHHHIKILLSNQEPKIITDLSTPQMKATGKPKPNY